MYYILSYLFVAINVILSMLISIHHSFFVVLFYFVWAFFVFPVTELVISIIFLFRKKVKCFIYFIVLISTFLSSFVIKFLIENWFIYNDETLLKNAIYNFELIPATLVSIIIIPFICIQYLNIRREYEKDT